MEKIFGAKIITIRTLSAKDALRAESFQSFINSLVKEKAEVLENKIISKKEAWDELRAALRKIKNKKAVFLLAEDKEKMVAKAEISLLKGKSQHVGLLRIAVRDDYRGMGLGTCLMKKTLELAKTQLAPRPKIVRLSVFETNKRALKFYEKFGFKKVASIPRQYFRQGRFCDELIMLLEI